MKDRSTRVVDCMYTGQEQTAAAYILREGQEAAIIETNTNHAVPQILAGLREEGLTPAQVVWVFVTHVHLDHAGGASALMEACPNATLVLHPKAAPHMLDPTRLIQSAKEIYGEETFQELYGTIGPIPEARIKIVEDGEVLALGGRELSILHTRGHANHHFCVYDAAEEAVFAGDSFGLVYPALQANGPIAIPSTPPTDFDSAAALESIDRILGTGAKAVYPTHFGKVTALEELAAQLREQLQLFQSWVEEVDASGLPDDALDEHFTQRVDAYLSTRLEALGILAGDPRRGVLKYDLMLNSQGLAFAIKKRRYKARKAQERGA